MGLSDLTEALEAYVLPNRIADAYHLATLIDAFVRARIAEAYEAQNDKSPVRGS